MNKSNIAALFVLIAIIVLPGCSIFRHNNIPEAEFSRTPNAQPLRLLYQYKAANQSEADQLKKPTAGKEWMTARQQEFLDVIQESGGFVVQQLPGDEDLTMTVNLWEWGNPWAEIPILITGYTLFIIPSWATIDVKVKAVVTRKGGDPVEYNLQDSVTLVLWLPLVVTYPFKPPSELADLRRNLYRNLLIKVRDDKENYCSICG